MLNLIVQDGLKKVDPSIKKVRDSVKFMKSFQARKVKFLKSYENVGIVPTRGLHGDVCTRWEFQLSNAG